ncbi:YDG domain-containing protein [Sphingomonas sp. AR_OL41]|uniref:YDG domain-containing protein n=1 Tax=Sphingomonas sp. AR_OL41 TaxID=3042729 RepID=UPI00248023D3|nr:YDG domain-containing protein [Sphingomonas sp. AR_OL41]MDH7975481.1 YDG domain-containing protein [Sphingomonas sp. AR_OL41]
MNKPTRLRTLLATSTVLVSGLLFVASAANAQAAMPDTGNVTAITSGLTGGVPGSTNPTFNTTGAVGAQTLTVNLKDNRTILNWGGAGFNIAAGNTVYFADSRATSGVTGRMDNIAVLNRVVNGDQAVIRGALRSDGNVGVYLVSQGGVFFDQNSVVDTGSFFASGLDLANDSDFLSGSSSLRFNRSGLNGSWGGFGINVNAQIKTHASASTDGGRMGDVVLIGTFFEMGYPGPTINAAGDVAIIVAGDVTVQSSAGSPLSFTLSAVSPAISRGSSGYISQLGAITGRNVTMAVAANSAGINIQGVVTATGAAVTDRGVVLTTGSNVGNVTYAPALNDPNTDYSQRIVDGGIIVNGSIDSAKDIWLRGRDRLEGAGQTFTATGLVDMTGGPIYSASFGDIIAGSIAVHSAGTFGRVTTKTGNLTFEGSGGFVFAKDVNIAGDLIGTGTNFFQSAGALKTGGSISVTTTSDQSWWGSTSAAGSINLTTTKPDSINAGGGTIQSIGTITSTGGDIRMRSTGSIDARAALNAFGLLDLESNFKTRVDDATAGQGMRLVANPGGNLEFDSGRLQIGSLSVTGSDADLILQGYYIQKISDLTTGLTTRLDLQAGRDISINLGRIDQTLLLGNVVAGRNVSATGASVDATRIEGKTGSVTVTAIPTAGVPSGGVSVTNLIAGTNIAVFGSSMFINNAAANNGNILLSSSGNAVLGGNSSGGVSYAAGNITVLANGANGTAVLRGNITAGGDIAATANSAVTIGNTDTSASLIKAAGAVTLTSRNTSINGLNNVILQGNSDGIGAEAITLDANLNVSFAAGTTILGGPNRESDLQVRLHNSATVTFGSLQARGLLGAFGAVDPFTNGITQAGPFALRGATTLTNTLRLDGSQVVIAAPITVTNGDIDFSAKVATSIAGALRASGDVAIRTTGGNMTIASNGSLTGRNVTLSTPAAFINNAGSAAINASGHWVVYSANPAGDTFGGLDSGNTALWNSTLATRDPSTVSGNRYIFALQPTLTFATQSFSKVYGTDLTGSNDAPFTVTGYQPGVGGAFLADTAATAFSGAPLITSPGFAPRASVAGGPYALSIAAGTLQSGSGYAFAFNSLGQLTITAKELTGTISVSNKTYDGTTTASGSIALNGVVAGDTVSTSGTSYSFADKNAGTGKTVNVTGTTLTGADAGNYTLSIPATALADILKAALTGTITVNNKTYDGTTAATGSLTISGIIGSDNVGTTGSTFAFADKNAGAGKTVTLTGTTLTGADAGNYTISIPPTALADIFKAALTGTVTVNNKTYDGTRTGSGNIALNGIVAGDAVDTSGTSFTFADKNAGTGKTVTISGTTLTGGDAGNYTLTIPATALADILKAVLTGNVTVNSRIYDGTTAATGSVTLSGVVAGETVGTTGTTFAFANKNAGTGKTANVTGTTLTGADAGNYTLLIPATALADILKAALTGTITVNNKTYDGTTAATGSLTISGIIGGDNVGTTGSTFAFADKNAGTGKTVTLTGTTLTGSDAGNYTISIPPTALADILKAALTGTVTVNNKTYDGTRTGSGAITLNGVVSGDLVGTSGTSFSFADKNAGTGKTVTVTGTTLTGADAGNYTLSIPATALADILKAALTGTITVNNKTYDGTTAATGSLTISGIIGSDNVGTTGSTFAFADKNAGTGKTVTVSGTALSGTDAGNYTLTIPASALADILKKALTGTATVTSKTYDGTTAGSGSVALSGLVSGDVVGASGSVFTFADKNAGTGKSVTVSGTALTGADAGNYTLSIPATALGDITRRVVALAADNLSKTQGASDPTFTYQISSGSLVAGDSFSGALTRASGELPGPYAITQGTLSAGNNYTLNFTPGTLTINLNPVTQQPQTLRALTLPSQIQAQTPSSSNVTLDQQDLCGADKNCVVK